MITHSQMLNKKYSLVFLSLLILITIGIFPQHSKADIIPTANQGIASGAEGAVFDKQAALDVAKAQAAKTGSAKDKQAVIDAAAALVGAKAGDATAKTAVAEDVARAEARNAPDKNCSITNFTFSACFLNPIALFIFTITNTLLGIVGVLLNLVVVRTIFQFSSLIGNSPGLLIGWGLLRDIGNMLLLFGFIYIGVSTILGLTTYSVKKTLPRLLLFAVLLNFSLFAAEAVIDVSNLFTTVMYNQANNDPCSLTSGGSQNNSDCSVNLGIAGHIMQSTGLSSVFASNNAGTGQEATTMVGLSIFSVVGIVVIAAATIMLSIRAVVLTFLMVTSPIGFAGMAIPQLNKLAKKWWDLLIAQSFFAPVLFLLIFISFKVTDSFGRNGNLGAALGSGNTSSIGVIFVFVIICGFLLASLKIASDMGALGAKQAIGFATKNTGRLTFGAGAFVARRTAGRASAYAAEGIKKSEFFRKNPMLGRTALSIANKGATSSYDVRATKTFANTSKAVGKQAGIDLDFGKPGKTAAKGYNEIVDKAKKQRDAFAKEIKPDDKLAARIKAENDKIDNAKKAIKERNRNIPPLIDAEKAKNAENIQSKKDGVREEDEALKAAISKTKSELEKTKSDIIAARTNNESFERKIELDKLFDEQQNEIAKLTTTQTERTKLLNDSLGLENEKSQSRIAKITSDKDRDNRADNQTVLNSEEILNNNENGLSKLAKLQHAKALETSGAPFPFVSKRANKLAADAVRKEVNKSKDEKDRDAIVKGLKDATKDDEKTKEEKVDKPEKPAAK
jgi:hypothetical protein